MENKSSQGATLSPVKLWSGTFKKTGSIDIPGSDKYNVFYLRCDLYGITSVLLCRGSQGGFSDDIGYAEALVADIEISGTTLKMTIKKSDHGVPTILEVWGIG